MAHIFENKQAWRALTPEQKLDALHAETARLFVLIEELSHKDHMLVDAVNLLHARLDDQAKAVRKIAEHIGHGETVG